MVGWVYTSFYVTCNIWRAGGGIIPYLTSKITVNSEDPRTSLKRRFETAAQALGFGMVMCDHQRGRCVHPEFLDTLW